MNLIDDSKIHQDTGWLSQPFNDLAYPMNLGKVGRILNKFEPVYKSRKISRLCSYTDLDGSTSFRMLNECEEEKLLERVGKELSFQRGTRIFDAIVIRRAAERLIVVSFTSKNFDMKRGLFLSPNEDYVFEVVMALS